MDPMLEKRRLFEEVPLDPETVRQAMEVLSDARRKVALGPSVISSIVIGMCHFAWTATIPTLAVKITGDGNPMLMANPEFVIKAGAEQMVFGLDHEAYHILFVHLNMDAMLAASPNMTVATEACINYKLMRHLGLPLIKIDGKVAIVDPDKVYDSYRDQVRKGGGTAVSKDAFFETDLGCFAYLESLPKPVSPKGMSGCVHASDPSGSGAGDGSGGMLDPAEVSKFAEKVLQGAIQAAKNGRRGAKEEVLAWMDSSPEASQMWGDLGAGALRGETTRSRKTDLWEKWTTDAIATRMDEGQRWRYNRKVPFDPRVSPRGREPRKHGAVFVDASGSMSSEVLDRVASLIGDLDNIEVEWHSFDGAVWPFVVGEPFKGGGGTSFQVIADHVAEGGTVGEGADPCCEDDPDFVLVLTDGYAPEIDPEDPDKWIWLIVPGGSPWPEKHGMSCRQIDDELAAAG